MPIYSFFRSHGRYVTFIKILYPKLSYLLPSFKTHLWHTIAESLGVCIIVEYGEAGVSLFSWVNIHGVDFVLFFYDVQLLCCISFTFWRVREKRGIQCNFCQIEGGHVYYL